MARRVGAWILVALVLATFTAASEAAKKRPACPHTYKPVCGSDDQTYPNACAAKWSNATIAKTGRCGDTCTGRKCPPPTCAAQGELCLLSAPRRKRCCGIDGGKGYYVCEQAPIVFEGAILGRCYKPGEVPRG